MTGGTNDDPPAEGAGDGEDVSAPNGGQEGFVAAEREHRLAKLDELRQRGIEPYPPRYDRDHTAAGDPLEVRGRPGTRQRHR